MAKKLSGMQMEVDLTFDPKSIREVKRLLRQVDKDMRKKAYRKALAAGAKPILKTARQLVPKRYGFLKKALTTKVKIRRDGSGYVVVGANRKKVYRYKEQGVEKIAWPVKYAHLVEFGTEPHYQKKRKKWHPGSPAQPFMRPAIEQNAAKVLPEMAKALKEFL